MIIDQTSKQQLLPVRHCEANCAVGMLSSAVCACIVSHSLLYRARAAALNVWRGFLCSIHFFMFLSGCRYGWVRHGQGCNPSALQESGWREQRSSIWSCSCGHSSVRASVKHQLSIYTDLSVLVMCPHKIKVKIWSTFNSHVTQAFWSLGHMQKKCIYIYVWKKYLMLTNPSFI